MVDIYKSVHSWLISIALYSQHSQHLLHKTSTNNIHIHQIGMTLYHNVYPPPTSSNGQQIEARSPPAQNPSESLPSYGQPTMTQNTATISTFKDSVAGESQSGAGSACTDNKSHPASLQPNKPFVGTECSGSAVQGSKSSNNTGVSRASKPRRAQVVEARKISRPGSPEETSPPASTQEMTAGSKVTYVPVPTIGRRLSTHSCGRLSQSSL